MRFLKLIEMAATPFVWHPLRAAVVGGVLLVVGIGGRRTRALIGPGVLWLAYAFWEWDSRRRCADIRIDLLLIFPVLLAATGLGLASVLYHAVFAMRKISDRGSRAGGM